MSARERFFKKVQQNKVFPRNDGPVEADIRAFCQQMDKLLGQIEEWLEGAGIDIILATKYLNDLSTLGVSLNSGVSRYEIATIRLQNGNRSVSIIPEQLYKPGEKGCATLIVDVPGRPAGKQTLLLTMAPDEGWFIRGQHQDLQRRIMLTEECFFRTIDCLAG